MTDTRPANADPLVSVVLPVYNAERYLARALDSVLAQSYRRLEILVVDDGSIDGSRAIAQRCADGDPDRVFLFRHEGGRNAGVSASRNLGLARARGELVAFLDADDCWLPGKLERQVACMREDPNVGLCYTRARIIREEAGKDFLPGTDLMGNPPPADQKQLLFQIITVQLQYAFSSVLARRRLVLAAGGFAEGLPFQSEDRLMVAKLGAVSRFALVDEVLCEYRVHGASYTCGVVRDRIAPAIFFDMQVRIVQWLRRQNGQRAWAKEIAHRILPLTFLRAVMCTLNPRILARVHRQFLAIVWLFPSVPVRLLGRVVLAMTYGHLWARFVRLFRRTALYRAVFGRNKEQAPS
ncbi:MAG: glycosyltransferase [Kiritimatiellae bacterium]|nr:glycosyltransferase [Kiritimatiellia bacterium]